MQTQKYMETILKSYVSGKFLQSTTKFDIPIANVLDNNNRPFDLLRLRIATARNSKNSFVKSRVAILVVYLLLTE
jgi:hypothetical protein